MKVVVITHTRNRNVVAVIENPNNAMSKGAVALAWAKAGGYTKIPTDVTVDEVNVTSFANVLFSLIPVDEGNNIKAGKYEDS